MTSLSLYRALRSVSGGGDVRVDRRDGGLGGADQHAHGVAPASMRTVMAPRLPGPISVTRSTSRSQAFVWLNCQMAYRM